MDTHTSAMVTLTKLGIEFQLRSYEPGSEIPGIGVVPGDLEDDQVDSVVKTLLVRSKNAVICAVVPLRKRVDYKKLSKISSEKDVTLLDPTQVSSISGYEIGGVSPLGMTTIVPVYIGSEILKFEVVYVNAGRRGLQMTIATRSFVAATAGTVADITK